MYTAIVTSSKLAKSGGIQTITQTLFKDTFPIFFLEKEENLENRLKEYDVVLFSGFDKNFIELATELRANMTKVVVFWHFSTACEVDTDIGEAWRALLITLSNQGIDLFITCKPGVDKVISNLFGISTFFIMNNALDSSYASEPKEGIGIYSGSSDYWVKNIRPNLYGALMTGDLVDILPYDDTLKSIVEMVGATNRVTGTKERLAHNEFLKRMSSRQLVTYATFTEGAPILPLEALNNGTICLTGNNHHYFEGHPGDDGRLKEFLTVYRPDDPATICNAIQRAMANREYILSEYRKWKAWYDERQKENFNQLIELLNFL